MRWAAIAVTAACCVHVMVWSIVVQVLRITQAYLLGAGPRA